MLFLQAKPPPPLENMNLQRDNAASHELFGLQHQRTSQANAWNERKLRLLFFSFFRGAIRECHILTFFFTFQSFFDCLFMDP